MIDQEQSTLFINLMLGFGRTSCVVSITVISMLKDIISRRSEISRMKLPRGKVAQYASPQSRQRQESAVSTNETNIL